MSSNIAIVGAGAIGRWTAYFLSEQGYAVTLIEKGDLNSGCSFGNAGMIVPSHVIPMAAPGMINKGVRWMFRSDSPFYVKPRLNGELFRWGRTFYKNANQLHVERSKVPLRDLSLLSSSLYNQFSEKWSEVDLRPSGLLMAYQSDKVGEEEDEAGRIAQELGLDVAFLDAKETKELEPNCRLNAAGGVLYRSDGLIDPRKWMDQLNRELNLRNVKILDQTTVTGLVSEGGKVRKVITETSEIQVDGFVVAAGAWSPELAKMALDKVSLLPGKGYSFKTSNALNIQQPTILCEGKVAVSPFEDQVQFGGTLAVTHTRDLNIRMKRVQGIVNTVNQFYSEAKVDLPQKESVWSGFRPCSPDGLPYIGRSTSISNLFYATGHGMMGISMAPATGKLIAQMIGEEPSELDLKPFRMDRF